MGVLGLSPFKGLQQGEFFQGAELLVLGEWNPPLLATFGGLLDWGLGWLVACTAWNNSTSENVNLAPQNPRRLLGTCKTQADPTQPGDPEGFESRKFWPRIQQSVISWGWVIIISFAIFPRWVSLIAGKKKPTLSKPGRFFEPRFFGVSEISSFKGNRIWRLLFQLKHLNLSFAPGLKCVWLNA